MKKEVLIIFLVLLIMVFVVALWDYKTGKKMMKENTENIIIENNIINFNSLTLKQKIAQMIIVRGDESEEDFTKLNMGGVHLDRQKSAEEYKEKIRNYYDNSKIKLFVTTDLEGAWTPFAGFRKEYFFPAISEIKTKEESYEIGLKHGIVLKELGFNMNFAPIAEFEDDAYGGRVFSGTKEEIKDKLENYIRGLQENVFGVCKHYPGKGMIKNTHKRADEQEISAEDLELFGHCFENNISAVMIGHQIVTGKINSNKKPSSVSEEVILNIPEGILVISDEVNMMGLKIFYLFNKRKLYRDLINAGENVILDFKLDSKSAYNLIEKIEKDVTEGLISEEKINLSVKKILKAKGYELK
ncbi:MAG: glycoside hydrolase family 3 N-terminal domain-containing protein [archaeon]